MTAPFDQKAPTGYADKDLHDLDYDLDYEDFDSEWEYEDYRKKKRQRSRKYEEYDG